MSPAQDQAQAPLQGQIHMATSGSDSQIHLIHRFIRFTDSSDSSGLHRSEDRHIHVAAADHGERLVGREERGAGEGGDCLLASAVKREGDSHGWWDSGEKDKEAPGRAVVVCLPALWVERGLRRIRSCRTSP